MKNKKPDYLDDLIKKQQKPYYSIKGIKEKVYQKIENSPSLTAAYVKLTEISYKYIPRIF